MYTTAEENYLKAIYKLQKANGQPAQTGALAEVFGIQAPSVTDMLKKLAEKHLVKYEKSRGVTLTADGLIVAVRIIRHHRIWETFLVRTLGFGWDQVHELAEQLEHVRSEEIVNRLEQFLQFPRFDPHGDPIPDRHGNIPEQNILLLSDAIPGQWYELTGIADTSQEFLQYLDRLSLAPGSRFRYQHLEPFDGSVHVQGAGEKDFLLSHSVANRLRVVPITVG
ncbi:MAG: metal-dependent transcriptional regulator [Bacteroidetes bacterium]|nr:metal-dependent transcriptional regulator [Bacteroidota bacterium]